MQIERIIFQIQFIWANTPMNCHSLYLFREKENESQQGES